MKKMTLFASLAIVLVAGSAFALFNGDAKDKKSVAIQVYYNENGTYHPYTNPPAGKLCQETMDSPCTVTLNGTSLPALFDASNIPSSNPNFTVTRSSAKGAWE